jgi:DNA repair protein RadA/Sms
VARARSVFICSACGYQSPRWLGRCPDCAEWNTLLEEAPAPAKAGSEPRHAPVPFVLDSVDATDEARLRTGVAEFDRVLGGGLVKGSVVLVGGEPGIGKSTLLLQALLALEGQGVSTLLVAGEESAGQVKLRARRLGGEYGRLRLVGETRCEPVIACLEEHQPGVCVVDSVQMLWSPELSSAPGSVSQIREVTSQLLRVAKDRGISLVLVGHVTKTGDLAGPRVLEHMVDTVLAFEGERTAPHRLLRAVKNRFGPTNEVGVFEMTGRGLEGVEDPSALFLEDGHGEPGSSVMAAIEGSRCLLAELQALVVPSSLAVPRRVTRGVEGNRLAMVVAVLSRRAGLRLGECDIFVNVAGGLYVEDPATDLPLALAVASALQDRPVRPGLAALGELSLTGQVRYVLQAEKRLSELARRGYTEVLLPARNLEELQSQGAVPLGLVLRAAGHVNDLMRGAFA